MANKSEGYAHRYEGSQQHQYGVHEFGKVWEMNGFPINLNNHTAICGRFDDVLPLVHNIDWRTGQQDEHILSVPNWLAPMRPPTPKYLAIQDAHNAGAREIASFTIMSMDQRLPTWGHLEFSGQTGISTRW